jgi:DNA (cytosine-5)-methyltransferase 1
VDYNGRPFEGMRELALFAGAGGGILGGHLLGWRTVCAVERDRYAASVLAQRQNDGALCPFPVWDDVCTFNGKPWRGIVDVVSGGFPCQDISVAGRGSGLSGERSGLWREFARIIREVVPQYVYVENSPALTFRGLDIVLSDLAALGFNAEWGVLGASDIGAPHKRERIWIVAQLADPASERRRADGPEPEGLLRALQASGGGCSLADAARARLEGRGFSLRIHAEHADTSDARGWAVESGLGRMANGVAHRVDRLRAIGNGQVPGVAAVAFSELHKRLNK